MRAATLVLLLVALVARGIGQQPQSRPTTRGTAELEYWDGDTVYLIHGVYLRIERPPVEGSDEGADPLIIRCEVAVVWLEKVAPPIGESEPVSRPATRPANIRDRIWIGRNRRVKELYVEGAVHIQQKAEVHQCERAFFDFVHERGIIVDPRSWLDVAPSKEGEPMRLSVLADELRVLSETQSQMIGARFSTCPYGNPHWHFSSETVEIYRARAARAPESRPGEPPPPSFYYSASDNWLYPGTEIPFPILWVPDLKGDSSREGRPFGLFKGAGIGNSNQFGRTFRLNLGDDVETKERKKWGEWDLFLHEFTKRGPGVGVDFAYEQPGVHGTIKTYYQYDQGEDEFYGKPPTENRWRLSFQQRAWLSPSLQLDLELNQFSDRGYYPTYFEREFKQDKPPETYAYIKQAFHDSAVTGLLSVQGNEWETTTEYRPKFAYDLITHPLFDIGKDPLYLTASAEIAHPRRVYDDELNLTGVSQWRADVDTLLEYPFRLGPAKLTPFAGLRSTYYQYDIAKNPDRTRTGFEYGGEIATQLWRDWDACGGLFDLDGLRHVVRPSLTYRTITGVDLRPDDLQFFDSTDRYDDTEILTAEIRNVIQTVRHRKGKPAAADEILDLDLEMSWFPNQARDNFGRPFSNLTGDGIVRFSDQLQMVGDFEWNPSGFNFEEYNIALGYAPSTKLQTYAGYRHFDDTYDLVYGQANWRASEKWLIRGYASYDFRRNEGVEDDFVLTRIGHDWAFSLILHADFVQDDFSVSLALEPRALFNAVIRPAGAKREPEFQYLGNQIIK